MYEVNGIVYAGEQKPLMRVKSVRATDDYKLLLRFSTDEQKIYDATQLFAFPVFTPLKDKELFMQAYVDFGTVVWNENLDISPEELYQNSTAAQWNM